MKYVLLYVGFISKLFSWSFGTIWFKVCVILFKKSWCPYTILICFCDSNFIDYDPKIFLWMTKLVCSQFVLIAKKKTKQNKQKHLFSLTFRTIWIRSCDFVSTSELCISCAVSTCWCIGRGPGANYRRRCKQDRCLKTTSETHASLFFDNW